jgi:hypothetical protein
MKKLEIRVKNPVQGRSRRGIPITLRPRQKPSGRRADDFCSVDQPSGRHSQRRKPGFSAKQDICQQLFSSAKRFILYRKNGTILGK